jgi:hypothetical protein
MIFFVGKAGDSGEVWGDDEADSDQFLSHCNIPETDISIPFRFSELIPNSVCPVNRPVNREDLADQGVRIVERNIVDKYSTLLDSI